jgi:hypothetical protein
MMVVTLIQWAADSEAASVEHVRVNHGGLDVFVAQEFLDGADVISGF